MDEQQTVDIILIQGFQYRTNIRSLLFFWNCGFFFYYLGYFQVFDSQDCKVNPFGKPFKNQTIMFYTEDKQKSTLLGCYMKWSQTFTISLINYERAFLRIQQLFHSVETAISKQINIYILEV